MGEPPYPSHIPLPASRAALPWGARQPQSREELEKAEVRRNRRQRTCICRWLHCPLLFLADGDSSSSRRRPLVVDLRVAPAAPLCYGACRPFLQAAPLLSIHGRRAWHLSSNDSAAL
ncbi:unnamed protein product [Urochloa humidicola]